MIGSIADFGDVVTQHLGSVFVEKLFGGHFAPGVDPKAAFFMNDGTGAGIQFMIDLPNELVSSSKTVSATKPRSRHPSNKYADGF